MALDIGAAPCGDFGSYHAEPVDPLSGVSEPSVFIFPYGILVNSEGDRFTVDAHYEPITREIYAQCNGIAHAVLDARYQRTPSYRLGLRTGRPPIVEQTVVELAVPAEERLGRQADALCAAMPNAQALQLPSGTQRASNDARRPARTRPEG